jgi:hypothetical protein
MLIGGVVEDEVDDHAHPAIVGALQELDELAERPQLRMLAVVVANVVAVVAPRGRVERQQPQALDAHRRQVVQPLRQTTKITDPVCIGVRERAHRERVNEPVPIPTLSHAAAITTDAPF